VIIQTDTVKTSNSRPRRNPQSTNGFFSAISNIHPNRDVSKSTHFFSLFLGHPANIHPVAQVGANLPARPQPLSGLLDPVVREGVERHAAQIVSKSG
jgi:hypothetical protein